VHHLNGVLLFGLASWALLHPPSQGCSLDQPLQVIRTLVCKHAFSARALFYLLTTLHHRPEYPRDEDDGAITRHLSWISRFSSCRLKICGRLFQRVHFLGLTLVLSLVYLFCLPGHGLVCLFGAIHGGEMTIARNFSGLPFSTTSHPAVLHPGACVRALDRRGRRGGPAHEPAFSRSDRKPATHERPQQLLPSFTARWRSPMHSLFQTAPTDGSRRPCGCSPASCSMRRSTWGCTGCWMSGRHVFAAGCSFVATWVVERFRLELALSNTKNRLPPTSSGFACRKFHPFLIQRGDDLFALPPRL